MKWEGRRQSSNMEDRRGMGTTGKVVAGGGLIGIIVLLLNIFGGESTQNLTPILEQLQQQSASSTSVQPLSEEDEKMGEFVATVLADTEDVWHKIFNENGITYKEPKMVLFRGSVQSACGGATSASGPFYCPADQKIYMDLDFFDELKTRFGAQGGDYAIAYVIAHEVGHHIQTLLGTSGKVRQLQQKMSQTEGNKLSVCLELQADFYAGLWTHYNKKYLEEGDIEEALSAANAVGDDAIQKKMQGHIVPDAFTHGTSEQRMYWFKKGFLTGDINKGDTFAELSN
ncbi:MAG: neutral zinc metallopeptidase [Flavobacteriaceae bacterium]|jgi:predicted metalloprotease|nr:neutral zinc metallopeptidase [Flavobacteriaceae bacterium]